MKPKLISTLVRRSCCLFLIFTFLVTTVTESRVLAQETLPNKATNPSTGPDNFGPSTPIKPDADSKMPDISGLWTYVPPPSIPEDVNRDLISPPQIYVVQRSIQYGMDFEYLGTNELTAAPRKLKWDPGTFRFQTVPTDNTKERKVIFELSTDRNLLNVRFLILPEDATRLAAKAGITMDEYISRYLIQKWRRVESPNPSDNQPIDAVTGTTDARRVGKWKRSWKDVEKGPFSSFKMYPVQNHAEMIFIQAREGSCLLSWVEGRTGWVGGCRLDALGEQDIDAFLHSTPTGIHFLLRPSDVQRKQLLQNGFAKTQRQLDDKLECVWPSTKRDSVPVNESDSNTTASVVKVQFVAASQVRDELRKKSSHTNCNFFSEELWFQAVVVVAPAKEQDDLEALVHQLDRITIDSSEAPTVKQEIEAPPAAGDERSSPLIKILSAMPGTVAATELLEKLQAQESAAAAAANEIRRLQANGDAVETLAPHQAKLKAHLQTAFELKMQLEELQVKELQARLSRLERQIGQRKELREKIVERRAAELISGDSLQWNITGSNVGQGTKNAIESQVLPSENYLKDNVQYFPVGPEKKQTNESAALEHDWENLMKKIRPQDWGAPNQGLRLAVVPANENSPADETLDVLVVAKNESQRDITFKDSGWYGNIGCTIRLTSGAQVGTQPMVNSGSFRPRSMILPAGQSMVIGVRRIRVTDRVAPNENSAIDENHADVIIVDPKVFEFRNAIYTISCDLRTELSDQEGQPILLHSGTVAIAFSRPNSNNSSVIVPAPQKPVAANASSLSPSIEAIATFLDARAAAIKNISVTTNYKKRHAFGLPFDAPIELSLITKTIMDNEGRLRVETTGQQINIEPDGKSARAYNGRWKTVFQNGEARSITWYESNPPTASIDDAPSLHGIHPREFTTHFQSKSVSEIIRTNAAEVTERVIWDDRPVTIVQTTPIQNANDSRRYRFWIDQERNVVVRRAISIRFAEGQPWQEYARIENHDYQEIAPGIWMPIKVKYESLEVTPEMSPEKLGWSYDGTNRDWTVNSDLPADTFKLAFPEGTFVNDHRAPSILRLDSSGKSIDVADGPGVVASSKETMENLDATVDMINRVASQVERADLGGKIATVAAAPDGASWHETDLDSFQGTWCFDVLQSNAWPKPTGTPSDSAGRKSEQRWTIEDDRIRWTSVDGEIIEVGFTMDPTKTPKQIDFTFLTGPQKGMKSIGIYEPQKGNAKYLWLCMTDPGSDAPRPSKVGYSSEKQQSMIGIYPVEEPMPIPVPEALKRFQGDWQTTLCDSTLQGLGASQEVVRKWRWNIRSDEILWRRDGEIWKLKLEVDSSKNPAELDLTYLSGPHKGAKCLGMFQWGGNDKSQLMIAIQDPNSDAPRPTKFSMDSAIKTGLMILEPRNLHSDFFSAWPDTPLPESDSGTTEP